MKKTIIFLFFVLTAITINAQWSIGVDGRFASWKQDDERDNYGTDIVLNYKLPLGHFFIMPSVGYFYQKFINEGVWTNGGHIKHKNNGYRSGFDLACVIGKSFGLWKGYASLFTGPRYAYALFSQKECEGAVPYIQNSLDWRIGVSYDIWKVTISAKCDIAFLDIYKRHIGGPSQLSTLAVGVAYNF